MVGGMSPVVTLAVGVIASWACGVPSESFCAPDVAEVVTAGDATGAVA